MDGTSHKSGTDVERSSFLLAVLTIQPDVVVLSGSIVEDSAGIQTEQSFPASVVVRDVLVHYDEFDRGSCSRPGGSDEGLVPGDGLFLLSTVKGLGFDFCGDSVSGVDFTLDIVLHFAEPVAAFLENGVSDGDFDL